ncbi:MAG: PDZ domain-containing protein [Phycisphaerales bacterium]|nr:PDZ domain-containing protein [Phycisphaerales bacterium]
MMRIGIMIATIAATFSAPLYAKSPAEIYKEFSGSLAIVGMKIGSGEMAQNITGPGVCVHIDQKGRAVFLTTAFGIQTPLKQIGDLTVKPGGLGAKSVPAEVMGVDPLTGMAFVRTVGAVKWTKVVFVGKTSGLQIGQQIVSIGLQDAGRGHDPYVGVAYVSGRARVPETLYRVTGGNLTGTCSPVFNLDGKVVGLVARQLPTTFQMATPRGQTYVGMTGQDEKRYFLPIDEFANTITSMPAPGAPKRRVWTGVVAYQPVTDSDAKTYGLKVPAVMLGKIVKGGSAEKAGLQERDLVIGIGGVQLERFPMPELVGKQFLNQLQKLAFAGKKQITINIKRGDRQLSATVDLVPIPKQPFEAERYINKDIALVAREKVPPDSYLDTSPTGTVEGLIVIAAPEKGPAGVSGLRRGDLLIQVNGQPVTTVKAMSEIITKAFKYSPNKTLVLLVQRGDKTYPISIMPPRK